MSYKTTGGSTCAGFADIIALKLDNAPIKDSLSDHIRQIVNKPGLSRDFEHPSQAQQSASQPCRTS